jgi:hypothetical protein
MNLAREHGSKQVGASLIRGRFVSVVGSRLTAASGARASALAYKDRTRIEFENAPRLCSGPCTN